MSLTTAKTTINRSNSFSLQEKRTLKNASEDLLDSTSITSPTITGGTIDSAAITNPSITGVVWDAASNITASTTQTQGQQPLSAYINEIAVVANANDTVTLPAAVAGTKITIINNGANTLKIFPASGDDAGAGANVAVTLTTGSNVTYAAYDAVTWEAI